MGDGEQPVLAAQYLRMSTEHQKYSIERQVLQLAAYAEARRYEVVATYKDEGKSGLSLKGRPALRDLIKAVVGGRAPFNRVLVLDVSRWGRFQNPDEAAHLEFICREAGIPVEYVAEPFNEWTGAAAAIVKSIKRIMAAEYSRELSARVKVAQLLHAKQGFKQGGRAAFGVRRRVIDFEGIPRQQLAMGERKNLASDRVRLVRGPASESEVIKRIFEEFGVQGRSIAAISRRLNREKLGRRKWTIKRIAAVLDSPHAQGVCRYNVHSSILGSARRRNPETEWVESSFAPPLLEQTVHAAVVARRNARRRRPWTDAELIEVLRSLHEREGRITPATIKACPKMPSPHTYIRRFGSLAAAYVLAGYHPPERRRRQDVSDEDLFAHLRQLVRVHGRLSGELIEADPRLPSVRLLRKKFGSLEKALEMAGYGLTVRAREMRERIQRRRPHTVKRRISDDALIAPLRRLYAEHGYLSGKMIERSEQCACLPTYIDRFGSIVVAYRLAGWEVTRGDIHSASLRRQKRGKTPEGGWTRPHLERALADAVLRHGKLTCAIITADPLLPCASTVARVFGSMRAAYRAIGFDPADD